MIMTEKMPDTADDEMPDAVQARPADDEMPDNLQTHHCINALSRKYRSYSPGALFRVLNATSYTIRVSPMFRSEMNLSLSVGNI